MSKWLVQDKKEPMLRVYVNWFINKQTKFKLDTLRNYLAWSSND